MDFEVESGGDVFCGEVMFDFVNERFGFLIFFY